MLPIIQQLDIQSQLPPLIQDKTPSTVYGTCGSKKYNCQVEPSIRKSNQAWVDCHLFDEAVEPTVAAYLKDNYDEKESIQCSRWKMLEYNFGYFTEHIDRQVDTETHYQRATQILLPPLELCHYEGGVLRIKTLSDQTVEVTPRSLKWTHVIIPIGLLHEITLVQGTRISYVRQIIVEKTQNKKYVKQCNAPGIQTLSVIKF